MFKNLSGILLPMVLLMGCGKQENFIPNVPVNFSAPLTDPRLIRLSSPGGAVTLSGYGVSGIIIYRTNSGGYVAYDRCSTVNPDKRCAVELDDPSFTVTDKCSGAKYLLEDGSPVKAPAKTSLKIYNTYVSPNSIQVTN
ncbi:nitrite reductase/ring-hydroxylating ferredoxin subunit [Pedobacter sp. UYP24]